MTLLECGQKSPLASVSEGEGDTTLWHILAPSLPGETEGVRHYTDFTGNHTML